MEAGYIETTETTIGKTSAGKTVGRVLLVLLGLVLVAACVLVAVYGTSAYRMYKDANSLADSAARLETQFKDGAIAEAQATAQSVSELAAALKEEAQKPQWGVATQLPVLGADVSAVQVLTDAADALSTNALIPLVEAYRGLLDAGVVDTDGSVNLIQAAFHLDEIRAMVTAVRTAEAEEATWRETIAALDEVHIPQLTEALEQIDAGFVEADKLIEDIEPILQTVETVTSIAELVGL